MSQAELDKIKARYQKRHETVPAFRYCPLNRDVQFFESRRRRIYTDILKSVRPLADKTVLEVGCGGGRNLSFFHLLGIPPRQLYGVDLLEDRVKSAKDQFPHFNITQQNAAQLTFESDKFDIVFVSTVFSSILDPVLRQSVAAEMMRVLKPNGIILWYDFKYNNPKNPDVRGIKKADIQALFSDCTHRFHSVTLAPPITRALISKSWILCELLENTKLLNTHYIAEIRPQAPNNRKPDEHSLS